MAVSALTKSGNAGGGNYNPITGSFGRGVVVPFYKSGTFTAPFDGLYRVRVWGGGGGSDYEVGGGGGGFALKTVELKKGDTVSVTVGLGGLYNQAGGTSSFGTHCSATGGASSSNGTNNTTNNAGGQGVGGDFNASGGTAISVHLQSSNQEYYVTGGGAGSVFGDGGTGGLMHYNHVMMTESMMRRTNGSGGGKTQNFGDNRQGSHTMTYQNILSLDHIGAGEGSFYSNEKGMTASGGGASQGAVAGFPAGGGGGRSYFSVGANGLVIVEY